LILRAVEDTDLIRKACRGDVEAYNLLISRWEKRVYNYLLRIAGDREEALDLSQDVFLKAYQNLRKLDDPARFAPWGGGGGGGRRQDQRNSPLTKLPPRARLSFPSSYQSR